MWEKSYQKWVKQNGAKPGPHPDPTHKWNTDPDSFKPESDDDDSDGKY